MRPHLKAPFCLIVVLLCSFSVVAPSPASAQASAGSITGQVQVSFGSFPSEPVLVTLTAHGATVNTAYTDYEGRFGFNNLSTSVYHVLIDDKGYLPVDVSTTVDPIVPVRYLTIRLTPREKPPSSTSNADGVSGGNPYVTDAAGNKLYPTAAVKEFQAGVRADEKHKTEEAIKHYRKAIDLAPEYYPARNNLGTLYLGHAQYAEAQEQFARVIQIHPTDAAAYFNLGNAQLLTGQYPEAARTVEEGLSKQPNSAFGNFLQGSLYSRTGDTPKAEASLRRSLELDPQMAQAHLALVNLFVQERRTPAAIAELKTFLKTFPEHPFAPKARDVLKKLEAASPN